MDINLQEYDWIILNSSGGKDSQTMLDVVHRRAVDQQATDRLVVIHADLGRVEWPGTAELAEEQARHYGLRFIKVKRSKNDLLEHVRARGKWPSNKQRYCTSDHKRGPILTVITQLTNELRGKNRQIRILNCQGMRAQESPARAKKRPFVFDERASNGKRQVFTWLPIHDWTVDQVWESIHKTGVPYHWAYKIGMPRLSCSFCIFAPKSALILAGKHRPDLLSEYVQIERDIKHTFRQDVSLESVRAICQQNDTAAVEPVADWSM